MKGLEIFFPPFDTIVCDPELEKYFVDHTKRIEPGKNMMGGYAIVVEKYMPPTSALFLQNKNIVAIYHKGRLVFDKTKVKKLTTVFADLLKGNMKGKEEAGVVDEHLFKRRKKEIKKSHLLYPITVLESERDNIPCLPGSQVAQLNKAIEILNNVREGKGHLDYE
ncbi:MAG: hypothetical protein KAV87_50655 [Desulfobacteraceae bacterium]|nr:hypothetical protein [Desulfobacteraceae bacterium]